MQNLSEIERIAETRVIAAHGSAKGKALWGEYMSARLSVAQDILPFIARTEPNLTDHGTSHINEVFENAFALLGTKACKGNDSKTALNANELYFLCLAILFHDLGNIHGRKEHNRNLEAAYKHARGEDPKLFPEKRLLFAIVEAHCGQTRDGSKNTIGNLESANSFEKERLDCQRVAAILRLADELAEGPQRTSVFMQKHFPYPDESAVFHEYANVTRVFIDRNGERIVLTFDIEILPADWGLEFNEDRLKKLLDLCYLRSIKLDLERKYNRHYCSLLRPFKKTEVSFHFHLHGRALELGIPKITLDDLVLPTPDKTMTLTDKEISLQLDSLIPKLRAALTSQK